MFAIVFVLASTGGLIPRSCDRRGRGDGRAQGRGRWTPVCTERSVGRPEAPPTPPRARGRLGPGPGSLRDRGQPARPEGGGEGAPPCRFQTASSRGPSKIGENGSSGGLAAAASGPHGPALP